MPGEDMTNESPVPVSEAVRSEVVAYLGYRNWSDATDYRLTGQQDCDRNRLVGAFNRFEATIRAEYGAPIKATANSDPVIALATNTDELTNLLAEASEAYDRHLAASAAYENAGFEVNRSPDEQASYNERYRAAEEASVNHWRTAIKLARRAGAILASAYNFRAIVQSVRDHNRARADELRTAGANNRDEMLIIGVLDRILETWPTDRTGMREEALRAELEHERRRANANWNEADHLRGLLDEHGIVYGAPFTHPASPVTAEGLAMQALQTIADWPQDINGSNSVDPRTHAATILRAIKRVCGVVPPDAAPDAALAQPQDAAPEPAAAHRTAREAMFVAGPVFQRPADDGDEGPIWQGEVQTIEGYSAVAEVYGSSKDEVFARQDAIIRTLNPPDRVAQSEMRLGDEQ